MRKIAYGATILLTLAVVIAELLHAPVLPIFALTSLTLINSRRPPRRSILNATFGNAPELIIGRSDDGGEAFDHRTRASRPRVGLLSGSLKNGTQSFSATIAEINASMLAIVANALALPTSLRHHRSREGWRLHPRP